MIPLNKQAAQPLGPSVPKLIVVLRAEKPIRQPGSPGDVAPIHIGYRHELGGLA